MRSLASTACTAVVTVIVARLSITVVDQMQDSTSTLRLHLAELADRLREVTP